MAQAGTDLVIRILEKLEHFEKRFDALDARLDRLEEGLAAVNQRIDRTKDTLTLIGSVLHQAVERLSNHDRRLTAPESKT